MKESWTKKAGDQLERAGKKLSKKGAVKIGNAVFRAGSKLEHSRDRKRYKK